MIRYVRSTTWAIGEETRKKKKVFYLENQYNGRIIIDEIVKKILQSIRHHTLEEIYLVNRQSLEKALEEIYDAGFKFMSLRLLEGILNIFVRVGIIVMDNEGVKDRQSLQEPVIPLLNNHPLVSAVVINFNGLVHLPELLDSLMAQSYPRLEVIVIDNGSTDASADFIRENYPQVKLFLIPKNVGHGEAFNIGMNQALGDLILHLDNDIVLGRHTVYQLAAAAQQRKQWAALAPKLKFYHNRAFINSMGNSIHKRNWGSDNFIYSVDMGQFDHIEQVFSACFGVVLINPEVVKKIGGLDSFYKAYYDDIDWCFRAQLLGYSIYTVPHTDIFHKFGGTMRKKKYYRMVFPIGNRLYFVVKNLEIKNMSVFLLNYLLEDIKNMGTSLLKGQWLLVWAYLRGYGRFFSSLPRIFSQRKAVQKLRNGIGDRLIFSGVIPINPSLAEDGVPCLDIRSLCRNYLLPDPGI
jgi:GT2 family glycosyltransferase